MSAETITIQQIPLGLRQFQRLYQKYATFAFIIAILLHFAAIGAYFFVVYVLEEEEPVYTVRILKYSDLGPPPSLANNEAAPQVAITAPAARPTVGIPVPVPDAEVSPDQTIPEQSQMNIEPPSVLGDQTGTGNVIIEPEDIRIDEEVEPPDFVAIEQQPVPVNQSTPTYPEIALKAGMEGTVYVKIWVDKEGKPKKVTVLKSDAEIFNQAAIDAAWKWVFTPAMMNNGPVAVNVTIPFRFKLK